MDDQPKIEAWCADGTCPVDRAGPAQTRTTLAQSAVHQAAALLREALETYDVGSRKEDDLVPHALMARARALVVAASHLLSDPDDVESIRRSRNVVLVGSS